MLRNNHNNSPPRAVDEYDKSKALLDWMIDQSKRVGNFYKATPLWN